MIENIFNKNYFCIEVKPDDPRLFAQFCFFLKKKLHIYFRKTTTMDSEDVCRVCRCPGDDEQPLYYPCACRGSIRYVHQQCLEQWLKVRGNSNSCELCNTKFSFVPGKYVMWTLLFSKRFSFCCIFVDWKKNKNTKKWKKKKFEKTKKKKTLFSNTICLNYCSFCQWCSRTIICCWLFAGLGEQAGGFCAGGRAILFRRILLARRVATVCALGIPRHCQ